MSVQIAKSWLARARKRMQLRTLMREDSLDYPPNNTPSVKFSLQPESQELTYQDPMVWVSHASSFHCCCCFRCISVSCCEV